jgi:hypothetical protein
MALNGVRAGRGSTAPIDASGSCDDSSAAPDVREPLLSPFRFAGLLGVVLLAPALVRWLVAFLGIA